MVMNRIRLAVLALLVAGVSTYSAGVPPEIEADILFVKAEKLASQKQWDDAVAVLAKIDALKVKPRDDYRYTYANALYHAKKPDVAIKQVLLFIADTTDTDKTRAAATDLFLVCKNERLGSDFSGDSLSQRTS